MFQSRINPVSCFQLLRINTYGTYTRGFQSRINPVSCFQSTTIKGKMLARSGVSIPYQSGLVFPVHR